MGLLPICISGEDNVIAGYEVVAVEIRDEVSPLVDESTWAQIEPWVVFAGDEAVCPN
jgi:hypothetical protein